MNLEVGCTQGRGAWKRCVGSSADTRENASVFQRDGSVRNSLGVTHLPVCDLAGEKRWGGGDDRMALS